jgi:hypothetical protein
MNLYMWWSEYLRAYSRGYLIAAGETVEQAKGKIMTEFTKKVTQEMDDMCWDAEDRADYYAEQERLIRNDLSAEPITVFSGALLIQGSD